MHLRASLILALVLAPLPVAGVRAQQGMALTTPLQPVPDREREVAATQLRPDWTARESPILPGGRLPNQATGPRKERVIRDICIGC